MIYILFSNYVAFSAPLLDLQGFQGRNRYIWTWRNCFCYPFQRKTLMLDVKLRNTYTTNVKTSYVLLSYNMIWMRDLAAFQPSPGRIFHVESGFADKNARCLRPKAKI